jgi:ribosomal protein L30E
LQSAKGSKLIIVSKSINSDDKKKLEEQAKLYQCYNLSSILAPQFNWVSSVITPFRVTAIAIKSGTAEE